MQTSLAPIDRHTDDHSRVVSDAYREHRRAVFAVAQRICGPVLAADVTQEVFTKLYRNPGAYDPRRGTLRALLVTMARRSAIDMLRADSSRRRREQDAEPAGEPDPTCADAMRTDEAARVATAISRLPPAERDAVVMAFYGQRSYREAAIALGELEGTTKSRIRVGLQRLRTLLVDVSCDAEITDRPALAAP